MTRVTITSGERTASYKFSVNFSAESILEWIREGSNDNLAVLEQIARYEPPEKRGSIDDLMMKIETFLIETEKFLEK